MTDETAQEILNGKHTGLTGNMREDDLICMAKLWLMRHKILEHVNEYAPGKGTEWAKLCDKIEILEAE